MTKADLVSAMAKASGGSKVSAERALDAFFVSVFDALKRGRRVTIGGFGTFMVSTRAERNALAQLDRRGTMADSDQEQMHM